jgi:hypothetical protein
MRYAMLPKNNSYPFYNMPDENYFGEFRELLSSIGHYEDDSKHKENNHNNTIKTEKNDDAFNEFSTFPKY